MLQIIYCSQALKGNTSTLALFINDDAEMKYLPILAVALITSGCTTYSITNQDLLLQPVHKLNSSQEPLKTFPVNVEATMSCYDSRIGNAIKTSCSNARRIKEVTKQFNERGLQPVKPLNESSPTLIVNKDSLNGFFEGVTGFFNIISFGIIPLHHYDDYTVIYTDEAKGIDITKTARLRGCLRPPPYCLIKFTEKSFSIFAV